MKDIIARGSPLFADPGGSAGNPAVDVKYLDLSDLHSVGGTLGGCDAQWDSAAPAPV
jgi:hypothetical protein